MARCPECAGFMKFTPEMKLMVCKSCGLALERSELENYWRKIKDDNIVEEDEHQQKKSRRKEWLEWYSKSKSEKESY
jgi:DNA-directed RNA polymerase subunit M/transcription elongation factor TFIIS